MKILVADDNKENRYLLEMLLKGNGYEAVTVSNGTEALDRLRSQIFGLIVSDIMMPVMDGFQLCRECKQDTKLKNIPFIFYTATYTDTKDEEFALKIGADKFIRKPAEPSEFLSQMQEVLDNSAEGRLKTIVPLEVEEKEVLKLYSQRLVNKLEHKLEELEKAYAMVQQSDRKYRILIENLPQKIFLKDRNLVYISCNEKYAQDLKIKPLEITGKTDYDFYPGELAKKYRADDSRVMESDRQEEVDEDYILDGQKRTIHTVKTPVKDENGKISGILGIFWDVTEQKQMQQQLMLTDRLASIGQLAAGIAHEINNPLTGIIGFSDLLLGKELPADIREDLDTINREAKRTAQIVKGLLTFSRKQGTEKTQVDIISIIQGVLQMRSYEHRINNIEVNNRFASDLPQIVGNGPQLQQVFINLIVNAEQAMLEAHRKGILTITTAHVGDTVQVTVSDDGPGISPENMRKLFTPFFTTKAVGKGTGIGLSICHGIVTEHGGRIYAESEPGKGATFIIELPMRMKL